MISLWPPRLKLWVKFTFLLILGTGQGAQAALSADEQNNVDIYKKSSAAVVNITTVSLREDFFFQAYPEKGVGSGAIIRKDGYVVTNDHVLGRAQKVSVTLHDKSEYPAKIVGRDPDTDIAVLKIDALGKSLTPLSFSQTALAVGQKVLAIGNPFGLGGSLSVGIISSLGRDIKAQTGHTIKDVIQTDAAINPGNSGGPLLNSDGEMIGVNAQIFSPSGGGHGVGFAISGPTVKKIVDQLVQFGQVLRPWLGVEGVGFSAPLLQQFGVPLEHGMMVTGIYKNSPAARTGLKVADREYHAGFRVIPVGGDIIYQIDDRKVSSMEDLRDYIFDKKSGTAVTLHYVRNGKKLQATTKLAFPPQVRAGSF